MDREVWVIWTDARDRPQMAALRSLILQQGWTYRAIQAKSYRDSAGLTVRILRPSDAKEIYERSHRVRLCAIRFGKVRVRLNPTRHILDERWLASLDRFLRYKAFVEPAGHPDELLARFDQWSTAITCENERRPEVLPLHTFAPRRDWDDLQSASGFREFERLHGSASNRRCESRLEWTTDPSLHGGRDPQYVGGLQLTNGLHWDVSGGDAEILTATDAFKVGRGSHLNIYPNGHVRPGRHVKRRILGSE